MSCKACHHVMQGLSSCHAMPVIMSCKARHHVMQGPSSCHARPCPPTSLEYAHTGTPHTHTHARTHQCLIEGLLSAVPNVGLPLVHSLTAVSLQADGPGGGARDEVCVCACVCASHLSGMTSEKQNLLSVSSTSFRVQRRASWTTTVGSS